MPPAADPHNHGKANSNHHRPNVRRVFVIRSHFSVRSIKLAPFPGRTFPELSAEKSPFDDTSLKATYLYHKIGLIPIIIRKKQMTSLFGLTCKRIIAPLLNGRYYEDGADDLG